VSVRSAESAFGKPPSLDLIRGVLRGHNVACWCKPGEPCHADVLLEHANQMAGIDLKRDAVMIDIACNDPDNGSFAGRGVQIKCGVDFIELEALRDPAPRFVELDGHIRLAGKKWPILGSKDWVGNWCWNGYWMKIDMAVDFFIWLHGRGLYDLTTGETRVFNLWKIKQPLDRLLIWRLMRKPSMHTFTGGVAA
jgi:hypothetical protein